MRQPPNRPWLTYPLVTYTATCTPCLILFISFVCCSLCQALKASGEAVRRERDEAALQLQDLRTRQNDALEKNRYDKACRTKCGTV